MSDVNYRRNPADVRAVLVVSVLLSVGVLWFSHGRSVDWARRGDEAFARCPALDSAENRQACLEGAAAAYKQAVRDFPFIGSYYAGLGRCYEALGRTDPARREYQKAAWLGYRRRSS